MRRNGPYTGLRKGVLGQRDKKGCLRMKERGLSQHGREAGGDAVGEAGNKPRRLGWAPHHGKEFGSYFRNNRNNKLVTKTHSA